MTMNNNKNNLSSFYSPNDVPSSGPVVKSYFVENHNFSDVIYSEVRVPKSGDKKFVYWSTCDFFLETGRNGYSGIQHVENNEYRNIFSMWDLKTDKVPNSIKIEYTKEGVVYSRFGGEGSGVHTHCDIKWVPDCWYGTAIKRWHVPGYKNTYIGFFMYDYNSAKWTHYVTFSVPETNNKFDQSYINGFLERFGGTSKNYSGHYRHHMKLYIPSNEKHYWSKPYKYMCSITGNPTFWRSSLNFDDNDKTSYIEMESGGIFQNDQTRQTYNIPIDYASLPMSINKPECTIQRAILMNNTKGATVSVEWNVNDKYSPQLEYKITIYQDINDSLINVGTFSEIRPEARTCNIPIKSIIHENEKYQFSALLSIISIFNDISSNSWFDFEHNPNQVT